MFRIAHLSIGFLEQFSFFGKGCENIFASSLHNTHETGLVCACHFSSSYKYLILPNHDYCKITRSIVEFSSTVHVLLDVDGCGIQFNQNFVFAAGFGHYC